MSLTQNFSFDFSKCLFKGASKTNLIIHCECIAYLRYNKEVRTVDIDKLFYNDEKIPDNLIWMLDESLHEEIEAAAEEHAKEKFYAIDTSKEYEQ